MIFSQAIKELNNGKNIRRACWERGEYIDSIPHKKLTQFDAAQDDWEIINNPQTSIL